MGEPEKKAPHIATEVAVPCSEVVLFTKTCRHTSCIALATLTELRIHRQTLEMIDRSLNAIFRLLIQRLPPHPDDGAVTP